MSTESKSRVPLQGEVIEKIDPSIIHNGPLHVVVDNIGEFDTNFLDPQTLLNNIGHTVAVLLTDFEHPSVEMAENDWVITEYDAKKQILRAVYVGKDEGFLLDGTQLFARSE